MLSFHRRCPCNVLTGANFPRQRLHGIPQIRETCRLQILCSTATETPVSTAQEEASSPDTKESTGVASQESTGLATQDPTGSEDPNERAKAPAGTKQTSRQQKRWRKEKKMGAQAGSTQSSEGQQQPLKVSKPALPKREPAGKEGSGRMIVERRWRVSRNSKAPRVAPTQPPADWPPGVPAKAQLENVVGIEVEFLVPGNAGGFLMGKRAQRMRAMGQQHFIGIQITRQTQKHLRSLRLYGTSPAGIVSYWEDLWARAAEEGVELLDKTLDGSQSKLSMKIPADLAGRLLGINGEQIQAITSMTECALRMTSANNAEALESDFRLLQLCGSGPALIAAIKEVLRVLWQKEKFRKTLNVAGYIHVPESELETASAIIPEVLAAHPELKSISWVQAAKKVAPGQSGDGRLMVLGPPAVAAAAKHQIESQWGTVDWSRAAWPGLNLPQPPVAVAANSTVELPHDAPVAEVKEQGPALEEMQAEFSKLKEGMQV